MSKQKKYAATTRREETETVLSREEAEKQPRNGSLTKKQAIELHQKYKGSLKCKKEPQFVTMCGGIRPLPILPPPDEED